MNVNLQMLIKACQELNCEYRILHETGNLVVVRHAGHSHIFANWIAPLNSASVARLCEDKEYFYNYFKSCIDMPKTKGYLNPFHDGAYTEYKHYLDIESIANNIELNFEYPVILKKNRGTWGINVFKCENKNEVITSLLKIYDGNSKYFDYVALSQEYIKIANEYRVLFLEGTLHCAYEKDISEAAFVGNLSRLHWEGAKAKLVSDEAFLDRIKQFCKPLFQGGELRYVGLDIAFDINEKLWLIEANSAPGFEHFVKGCGEELAVEWYKKVLLTLFKTPSF